MLSINWNRTTEAEIGTYDIEVVLEDESGLQSDPYKIEINIVSSLSSDMNTSESTNSTDTDTNSTETSSSSTLATSSGVPVEELGYLWEWDE